MKGRPLAERMGFALEGLQAGWRRERSFRTHVVCAIVVALALVVIRPAPLWWAVIAIVVSLVLAFELMNSALEGVIDLLHPGLHPEIKAIKDMAAGAVLVISFAAVISGLALGLDWIWR